MHQVSYDLVADEYYDERHKTCRNFDTTSKNAMQKLASLIPSDGHVLEVGCGRGRLREFLSIPGERVIQLDSSRRMLGLPDRDNCLLKLHADATAMPLYDEQFSAVVGLLVDPFMGLLFLAEAFRVLRPRGILILSTPTPEWGHALRGSAEPDASYAKFAVKSKDPVLVPSTLIPKEQLQAMLTLTGFDDIEITEHALPAGTRPISPDIESVAVKKNLKVHDLPIIYVICARKP
jgi:SAM-dependent methyltransferase